ncbi:hypothetical protein GALL_53460 [mine drainage metagenome]|uniref:Uncharacterized protein n=1 Tax=mine drainage metagenome TaxID=410659 RepID=A0A1J5SYA3_9ZZZZ
MDAGAEAAGYDRDPNRMCTMSSPLSIVPSASSGRGAASDVSRWYRVFSVVLTILLLVSATHQARASDRLVTGRVLSIAEVRQMIRAQTFVGDDAYAVLESGSLHELQHLFETELAREGVSTRRDSEAMTDAFVATAQMAFVVRNWSSRTQAKAVAVGEVWLQSPDRHRRAVVVAITERGVIYWDPETACELKGGSIARSTPTLCRI